MRLSQARTALAAATFVIIGPLLAHFWIVRPLVGFWIFAAGGLLALIAVVFGLIAMVRGGFAAGGGNLVIGAIVTAIFLANALPGRGFPRINDITTDTSNPPRFVAAAKQPGNDGRDLSYPGETFADQQESGYPDLAGLNLPSPPDEVFARVQTTAQSVPGWEIINVDANQRTVEGVATSSLFRFQDDFIIEVRPSPAGNGGSLVEMRSKSRVGRGDIGANAARIQMFLDKLKNGAS